MKKLLIVAVILIADWQYLQQRTRVGEMEVPSDWNQQLLDQSGQAADVVAPFLRWPDPLLADNLMRGGHVLH